MINSESKRLARMIQTFLDIERLTDGQMEIRSEVFDAADVIRPCLERARPLAERKQIEFRVDEFEPLNAHRRPRTDGVRRLQSADQRGKVFSCRDDSHGIGWIAITITCACPCAIKASAWTKKNCAIFSRSFIAPKKRKRQAKRERESDCPLWNRSLHHHGGRMEVTSTPGKGSCFTMVITCRARVQVGIAERGRALNEGLIYCHVCWSSKMTARSGTP